MKNLDLCPPEVELNDYLAGVLPEKKKGEVERHIADCNACLEKMVFAYQAVKEFNEPQKSLPAGRQGVKPMKTGWTKNLWLFGAIVAFALSFLVHRYFVQCLVAAILMGTKWIFDTVNARILIMIYDAWKKGGEEEASKILKAFNDRINR